MRMNIEAERSRQGMTKTKLCEILGISLTTYSAYLKGSAIPSSKLVLMADMFGVSCDYLLGRPTTNEKRSVDYLLGLDDSAAGCGEGIQDKKGVG